MQQLKMKPKSVTLIDGVRALKDRVLAASSQIEKDYGLPDDLIAGLRDIGLFRATWPKSLGGSELDLLELLYALEELSSYDGSVGWVGTFAAVGGLTAAHLSPEAIAELYPSVDSVSAGQYAPVGKAERVDGGYIVNGRWSFGSGCLHSDVMTGGVIVTSNGEPVRNADGKVDARSVVMTIDKVELMQGSWRTTGMRGTGSLDYAVRDVFVPESHTFDYFAEARFDGPLYASPLLFLCAHLPMPLGIARAAIDSTSDLAQTKRYPPSTRLLRDDEFAQTKIAEAEAMLGSVRAWVYEVVGDIWDSLRRGQDLTSRQKAMFRLCLVHTTRVAHDIVLMLYDVAGSSAIKQESQMDRLLRDIMTVSQHRVVSSRMYRPAGKVLLGLKVENDPFF